MLKLNSYLIDFVPEPVLRLEANFGVIWANDRALRLKTAGIDESVGIPKCYEFLFGTKKPCANCAMMLTKVSKGEGTTLATTVGPGNTPIYIRSYATYLDEYDNLGEDTYLAVCVDVTDEQRVIKELKERISDAEEKETIDPNFTILSKIAKDLRSQMNGVMGMAQLLRSLELDEAAREYTSLLNESCLNVNRVIDTIEEASKVQKYRGASLRTLENAAFKLSQLMNEITTNYSNKAALKGLEIEFFTDRELPDDLYGDYFNLYQIVSFTLENAILSTRDGRISLSLFRSAIVGRKVDLLLKLEFGNTGGRSLEDSYCDLGMIKKHVDLIGGRFETGGNTVMMHLPFEYTKSPDPSAARMFEFMDDDHALEEPVVLENGGSGKPSIVVADSDVASRLAIKSILRDDYDIHLARTGEEALEMYERLDPTVLIVDILMPGLDGFDVLDIIDKRGIRKGRIVACTERIVETEPEYLMKYGFDDYLAKPVKANILRMVVESNTQK